MNDSYEASLRGRAQRYTDGRERTVTSTVAALAGIQQKHRATVVTLQDLEEELALENRRRLVAEKALMDSEHERHLLENELKERPPRALQEVAANEDV